MIRRPAEIYLREDTNDKARSSSPRRLMFTGRGFSQRTGSPRRGGNENDPRIHDGSAVSDATGRLPAGLRHGPLTAESARLHIRHARQADLLRRHSAILRNARRRQRPGGRLRHRQEPPGQQDGRCGRRRRRADRRHRPLPRLHEGACRPAYLRRSPQSRNRQAGQTVLPALGGPPLARDGQPRNVDGTGLPPRGQRHGDDQADPRQRHHADPAGARD